MSPSLGAANGRISALGEMPYGLARSQAAEQEVARISDEGPREALAYALATLVESLVWSGEVEKAYVPFATHVRWWDQHPELFDETDRRDLFWSFKWMVGDLMDFPEVPAAQIEATLADMQRRYAVEGLGQSAVAHCRWLWASERGVGVDEAYEAWLATPRDGFSQCEACEPGDRASYLVEAGRLEEAALLLEQTLAGDPRCGTEPADMLSWLQLTQLALGRDEQAAATHRRALRHLAQGTGPMTTTRGRHIEFLARAGQDAAVLQRLHAEAHLLTAAQTPAARFSFLESVGVATTLLVAVDPSAPVDLPGVGARTVAELDAWVRAAAHELADAFDRRNGTDARRRRLATSWTVQRRAHPVELSLLPAALVDGPTTAPQRPAADGTDARSPAGDTGDGPGLAGAHEEPVRPAHEHARERAELAVRAGRLEEATSAYVEAASAAERAGRLGAAAWDWLDAAGGAAALHDDAGALRAFTRGFTLAEAAHVPVTDLVTPLRVAVRTCDTLGEHARGLGLLQAALARLDAAEDAAARDEDPPVTDPDADAQAHARRLARTELMDASARLHAARGEHQVAADLAQEVAEAFAGLGRIGPAAHAFWLAGRMHEALAGPGAGVWFLESAVEGLTLARESDARGEAAGELIVALRALGRDAEADAVTR